MAKKKSNKDFEFSKVGTILDNISKKVPIYIEKEIEERSFISTGVYILDAALSAHMLNGGIPTNRISAFAGESGSGKSFLAYSVVKNAQKLGYSCIYIDTEQSIDLQDLSNYGIDTNLDKFRLIRSNKVEDINMTLTQLVDDLKDQKMAGSNLPKILLVLDSLGQMASNKEKLDLLKGDIKQDMTKAKALSSMFRSLNTDLGILKIPFLVINQTYRTLDMFPKEMLRGGNGLLYSASVIGFLSKSKLKTGDEDDMDLGQSGINVLFKTSKNRLAKPKKIRFDISFVDGMNPYTGLEAFCRPEYFEKIGIGKGKMELDKDTGELSFKPGGNKYYVRHLDKSFFLKKLHKANIFTDEILEIMNPIVNDYFRFKSMDEIEETEKEFNKTINDVDDDDDTDGFSDATDAEDLFG
jgi:RecA/RadA recombinase